MLGSPPGKAGFKEARGRVVVCLGGGGWGAIFGWKAGGLAFPQARATVDWSAEALPREPVAAGPWGPRRPGG